MTPAVHCDLAGSQVSALAVFEAQLWKRLTLGQ